MRTLVIGGTGRVGAEAASRLAGRADVRVLTRTPDTARVPEHVKAVRGDPAWPSSVVPALDDVDAVVLVFPSVAADHAAAELVREMAARVGHVVYLSAAGVPEQPAPTEPDGTILGSHAHLEGLLTASGVPVTLLRSSGFATNTLGWAEQLRRSDTLRWFGPTITRALVHEADLGAVAAETVLDPATHAGLRHHLTGPEQLTQLEQLAAIGTALGRDLSFEELDDRTAAEELFGGGSFARSIVAAQQEMAVHPEPTTPVVGDLLGRPARSYAQWAHDHREEFRGR